MTIDIPSCTALYKLARAHAFVSLTSTTPSRELRASAFPPRSMTRCESDLLARNSLEGVVDVNDTKACARANLYKAVHDGISIVM